MHDHHGYAESRPGTGDETSSDLEPVSPSSRPGEPTYTDGTQVVNEVSESASDKTSSNIGDLVSSGTLAVVNLTALVSLIAVSLLILL